MASHFSSIGFDVPNLNEFNVLVLKAVENGITHKVNCGTYIQWIEKNGAELWIQVDKKNRLIGANPHFSGRAKMKVGLIKEITRPDASSLDGAYYCWANPRDDNPEDGEYPFVFNSPNSYEQKPLFPSIIDVQISAFAHELKVYTDENQFIEMDTKFAPESFVPTGLFDLKSGTINPPEPHAFFNAKVIQCSILRNEFTGCKYFWALVRTLGGEFDLVADMSLLPNKIHRGNIVSGSFYLSGKILPKTE